ncbi:MAG: hypothetical protein COZ75_13825 [Flavobacteriaceae bacterium CG_4_8_14_3_um_filter_34_10]|nr:hypothetical protein [Flavobacteriia bacterium]OIP52510.1 MAG: hypothetical protein AUK33_00715 [Flavobacteriaceae bacterium CG2_30_34_30]PIQ17835.1 MAG: hypothetical protein COW66_09655 [Flavobacteriaceae bacterium CG18_big_fil_WC_8_21_14_2_50_34_36]PIV50681.1 MAG: hypothetical protein COS19_03565 [Flavobacteriaceae bacterium CG02_land_8_20_14_3_00_34_13]PIX08082.1 MAG: hypothetical protein COZ75_13825 [Flavobacteriaceae bacterium CG_4_8_14_3_um_filter_34_10]PIZ07127.1 MAG: hypothetical pr
MNKILLVFLTILFLNSCSNPTTEKDKGGWIGGEIVNPVSNHILLTKNEKIIDTIPLDSNNRFLYRLDSIEKGLYNFIHNEYQIIYLEPGDSLMIYLNTLEFDESLAFSGKGAERNNFLIEMFLYNEEENQKMPAFYQLNADLFIPKLDSMRQVRLKTLDSFTQKHMPCDSFLEVIQANINYDYFAKRELYPYAHFGRKNIENTNKLSDKYFDFRSEIEYNNKNLQSYYTYYRFLLSHFDNLAFEQYKDQADYDNESYLHVSNKLKQIDKSVTLETLKNSLLRSSTRQFVMNSKNRNEEKLILDLFNSISTDDAHKFELEKLSEASQKIMPGNNLPNVSLVNYENQVLGFNSIIKEPTVIYFWSDKSVNHYKNVHSKVEELTQKYPEFNFLAINTNEDQEAWKRIVKKNNYNKNREFRFQNPKLALENLVISVINKVMIVDKNGVIIDNNTNLFSVTFEEELLGILNQ